MRLHRLLIVVGKHILLLNSLLLPMSAFAQQDCGLDYSSVRNDYGGVYDSPSVTGRVSILANKDDGQLVDWGVNSNLAWVRPPPSGKKIVRALSTTTANYIALSEDNELFVFGKSGGDYGLIDLPPLEGKRYRSIYANHLSFAVLDEDGRIYSWGRYVKGLVTSNNVGYVRIHMTHKSFAALHADGHIVTWDVQSDSPEVLFSNKKGFTQISTTLRSFAALDSEGRIYTWGDVTYEPPSEVGYVRLRATSRAFAAIHENGEVKSWGDSVVWLDDQAEYAPPLAGDYVQIHSTGDPHVSTQHGAFAVLDTQGRVFSWGASAYGGTGAPTGEDNKDFVRLSNNARAFAALRKDGSIVAWGHGLSGGEGEPTETGFVKIFSTAYAFAALHKDGYVKAWGTSAYGGDNSSIVSENNISWIASHTHGFVAFRSDGSTISWGRDMQNPPNDSEVGFESIFGSPPNFSIERCRTTITFGELRGEWHLDETDWSGSEPIKDKSPFNNHGSLAGNVKLGTRDPARPGNPGTCGYAEFDGDGDAITFGNPDDLNFAGEITMAAWVRPDKLDTAPYPFANILAHGGQVGPILRTALRFGQNTLQSVGQNNSDTSIASTAFAAADVGQWVHLTGVYTGSAWRLYKNAQLVDEVASANGAQSLNAPWALGANGAVSERFFKGAIDEPRIYNYALEQSEVQALYEEVRPCPEYVTTSVVAEHDTKGVFYCPETVRLVAYTDSDHLTPDTSFTGTVRLEMAESAGVWSSDPANNGNLSISGHILTYEFVAADQGVASFYWLYSGESSSLGLTLSSVDGSADVVAPASFDYAQIGFRWTVPSTPAGSEPPLAPPTDIKAGEKLPLRLQAVKSVPESGSCVIAEAYQPASGSNTQFTVAYQDSSMKVLPVRLLDVGGSTELGNGQGTFGASLSFSDGQADLSVQYRDVGQMSITAQDTNRLGMQTATYSFLSRPHHLALSLSNPNPISGSGFAQAGEAVTARVRGYSKGTNNNSNLLPSFGRETPLSSEATLEAILNTPSSGQGAVLGTLDNNTLERKSEGTLESDTLSYDEVGSIDLSVSALAGPFSSWLSQYSGPSLQISNQRFVAYKLKAEFSKRGKLNAACGTFQYIGQPLEWQIRPALKITGRTQADKQLLNYGLAHNPLLAQHFNLALSASANAPTSVSNFKVGSPMRSGNAVEAVIEGDFDYMREPATERDPFNTDLIFALNSLVDVDGAALPSPYSFSPENHVQMRFGRVRLLPSLSQWESPQPLEAFVEYYQGARYQLSDSGSCAHITHLSVFESDNPNNSNLSSQWASQLDHPIHTSRNFGSSASLRYQPSALVTQAEAAQIQVTAHVPEYLRYPWGGWSKQISNPAVLLSFGVYAGVPELRGTGGAFVMEMF